MKINTENIKKYFSDKKILGNKNSLKKINYLGGSNHFNYKISTNQGDFVLRINNPKGLGAGVLCDIPGEFSLLKIIENKKIAPKAVLINLESPFGPFLIEKFITGTPFTRYSVISDEQINAIISLIKKVSNIELYQSQFPFQFTYTKYQTNIKTWKSRLSEISHLGNSQNEINEFLQKIKNVIRKGQNILLNYNSLLQRARPTFIYNDVHAGNTFWLPREKWALFIDWQKVSLGDPAFMLAVFALAFENKVKKSRNDFFNEIITKYTKINQVINFKKLFWLRILEREISNTIWAVWTSLKQNKQLPFSNIEEYGRLVRARKLVNNFD